MQMMRESKSVIDLEERLKQSGLEFPNYKKYIRWLKSEWYGRCAERVKSVLETSPEETRFPTFSVELEGVKYQLHGIVHGWPIVLAPGWHPRRNIIEYISKTADSFHKPDEREDYLYEQNLDKTFKLLKLQELKDHEYPMEYSNLLKSVGMSALVIPIGMLALITQSAVFGGLYLYSKTIRNPKGCIQGKIYLSQKALTDERYLALHANFQLAREMPQPYELEVSYLLEKASKTDPMINRILLGPHHPTRGERSLRTAKLLRDYAERMGLKTLHYIGGTAHITEIAYFLQNPDFSFERLEEYRVSRR